MKIVAAALSAVALSATNVGAQFQITPPSGAEQSCDRYATFKRLPDSFEEIASGLLAGGLEFFVLTDGACTCDSRPAVDRKRGKPAPQNVNWSCRKATPDERDYTLREGEP
jgi:hypothetical protein